MKKLAFYLILIFIFSCEEKKKVDINKSQQSSEKNSIILVDTLKKSQIKREIKTIANNESEVDTVKIKSQKLSLFLVRKRFKKARHKIEEEKLKIDGIEYFGTDGDLPRFELTDAYVIKNGKRIDLKTEGMYNPWFGNGNNVKRLIQFTEKENMTMIFGIFSDGAGSYACEWVINENNAELIELSNDEKFMFKYE